MNISQKSDMKSFLDPTIKAISTALELPSAIWLFDEDKREFRIVCSSGLSDEFLQDAVVSEERAVSVIKEKFENRKSLIVPDIQNAPFWRRKEAAEKMNLKSAVASTLRIKTQAVGGVVVYVPKDIRADLEKLAVKIETFAVEIANTLRYVRGLEKLHHVGHLINSEISSPDFFKRILESVQKVLNCEHVTLFITDQDNNLILEKSSSSIQPKRKYFKHGKGLAGYVAKNQESLLVADVRDYKNYYLKGVTDPNLEERSMLLSPITFDNKLIGVISADFHGLNGFDKYDLNLLELFAKQASSSIHNMKLYKAEQEKRQHSDILRKTFEKIEITKDRHILCDQIIEQLFEIVKFDFASIELIRDDKIFLYAHKGSSYFYPENTGKIFERFNINKDETIIISDNNDYLHKIILALRNSERNVIGTLNVICSVEKTERKLDLLRQFANQVSAKLLENDIFLKEKERFKTLLEIEMKIASEFQICEEEMYYLIDEEVTTKFGMENFFIALHNEKDNIIEFKSARSNGHKVPINSGEGFKNRSFGGGKIESVITMRDYLLLMSREELELFGYIPDRKTTNSWLSVPMRFGGKVIGVMGTYHDNKNHFKEEDAEMLQVIADFSAITIENRRLRDNRINALKGISEITAAAADINKIVNHILSLLNIMMRGNTMSDILLLDKETNTLKMKWIKGDSTGGYTGIQIKVGDGLTGWAAKHRQPLKIGNVSKDIRYIPQRTKTKSEIVIPLILENDLIGVLNIEHDELDAFTEDDFQLSKVIGNIAALAIDNADMYDELQKQTKELKAAYDITKFTHKIFDLNRLCGVIHGITGNLMSAKNFRIVRFNPDGKASEFIYYVDEINKNREEQKEIINRGKTAYVFKNKKTLLIPRDHDKVKGEIEEVGAPSKSWIGVPLKIDGNAIGVLTLHNYDEEGVYGESEVKILEFVSEQIAMAVERAQTHEHIEKQNKQQKVLIDLAQKLTSSIELKQDHILQSIHKNASDIMDTDNMYIALYDEQTDLIHFPLSFKNNEPFPFIEGEERRKTGKKGRTEYIIERKQSLICETKQEGLAWYNQPGHGEFGGDPLASFIGVPMIAGDKVLGVVATYHPTKDYVYSKDDLEILQTMANIAAIALENSRLYQQITEKVEELKKAQNQIADRERDLVISMISMDFTHKINNLVGTIPSWVQLTKRVLNKEKIQNKKIDTYLNKIVRDINIILEESDELRKPPSSENINIEEEIGSIVGQIEMQTSPDIQIEFNPELSLLPVHGIKRLFSAAIHSVIKNGINAISGQGNICIGIKEVSDNSESDIKYIEINISDTGCGLSQDRTESIFEHSTSFWPTKSTGYGLWRARNIIQSMGGSIKVKECMIGKGTTFTIILPAVKQSSQNLGG